MKNNKRSVAIGIGALLVIVLGVIIYMFTINNPQSKAQKASIEMGKAFYEDFYYDLMTLGKTEEAIKDVFDKRKDEGIKINIDEISKVNELDVKEQLNVLSSSKIEYDLQNSVITIFPTGSYLKTEYKIQVNLIEKAK